jgi:hypothetical protein
MSEPRYESCRKPGKHLTEDGVWLCESCTKDAQIEVLKERGDRAVALLRMVRDGYRQGASAEVDAFLAEEDAR